MSQFEKYTNHLYRPKCYSSPWLLNHVPVKLHETYHEKETWSTCPHDLALSPTVRNEQNALLFLLYISFSETHHSMPVGTIHSKPLGTTHSKPLGTIVKVNVWHEQSSTLGHNLIETIPQPVYDWWLDMISCAKGFTGDIYITCKTIGFTISFDCPTYLIDTYTGVDEIIQRFLHHLSLAPVDVGVAEAAAGGGDVCCSCGSIGHGGRWSRDERRGHFYKQKNKTWFPMLLDILSKPTFVF